MLIKSLSYTGRVLLILCAAQCTLGILVSAFDLYAPMNSILVILLISTLVVTAVAMRFKVKGLLISTAPALILLVWNFSAILNDFKYVVYKMTLLYSKWIPVPVLFLEGVEQHKGGPLVFFTALGITLVFLLAATICLKRSVILTMLATLPFVLLTLVLVETQANAIYFLGLTAVYLTLLIGNAVWPDDPARSTAMFIPVFLISTLFVGAIYLSNPPARYERTERAMNLRYYVNNIAEQLINTISRLRFPNDYIDSDNGWFNVPDFGVWAFNTTHINIANSGRRIITDQSLLEITASHTGRFYIKGFSMSSFYGGVWTPHWTTALGTLSEFDDIPAQMPATILSHYSLLFSEQQDVTSQPPVAPVVEMNIRRVNDITSVGYKPYYLGDYYTYSGDYSSRTGYDMRFYYVPGSVRDYAQVLLPVPNLTAQLEEMITWLPDGYTIQTETGTYTATEPGNTVSNFDNALSLIGSWYKQIDPDTAAGLRQLAIDAGIDPTAEREAVVDAVAAYIRSSGRYTLDPPATPPGEDFALYFLQTSREGYCIHFATAATLMLRALDIPARFTSGYVATVSRIDTPITLTDRNAHAWVEVLYEDIGWLPLEVTPSGRGSLIPPPQLHSPAELQPVETPPPTPDEAAESAPVPIPGQNVITSASTRKPLPGWLINIILFVSIILALVLTLVIRRQIIKTIRNNRFEQKNTNAAVISMWRHTVKISRRQAIPPTDIEELALKARFSQHRITEKERKYMLTYTRRLASEVYESKGEYSRFWFRYILGLL